MTLDQLDAIVRIAAITTILILASLLLRQRRAVGAPAWLFAPLALCLSGFLIGNTPASALRLSGGAGAIAHFASGFSVVFLWWFCLSCFERGFRPRGVVLATGIAWATIAAADRGLLGRGIADAGLSDVLVPLGFGIVGHLVWRLAAERAGDLIQKRHDARLVVALLLGSLLFIDLCADVLFGFAWRPRGFAMAQNATILGFGLWLTTRVVAVRPSALTFADDGVAAPTRAARGPDAGVADDALRRRLSKLIDEERIFLDPELSFDGFVARMGASERTVRRLINHELGFDHFRSFLNHYRMAEARRLLSQPRRDGDKLIVIALDSGFASLASFNRVFRATEGCAPSEFREGVATGRRAGEDDRESAGPGARSGFEERSSVF